MKPKFERVFRAGLIFLLMAWAWSVWAAAQPGTNSTATAATNRSSTLVQQLEQLNQRHLTFGFDQLEVLRDHYFLGEPLWKYAASLAYILLAFAVARIIDFVAFAWLKRLAARTETKLDDLLLELLRGPVKVVAFVVLLHLGLTIFDWSETARAYFSKLLILIVAGSLTYLTLKIVNLLLEAWRQRTAHEADRKFNDQLFSIIRKSLNVFVIIVAVMVTAQNIGINITAAITSLSIGGLAVGLAAQDTLANLFGAVAVFADKPFRVGDHIKLADAEGTVEAVGMRSTRIRNLDGQLAVIPNKTVANAAVINISKRPSIKTVMNLTLAHDLPGAKVKRALALLTEIYRGDPLTQDVWISFNQFAGRNLNILVMLWSKGADYQKYLASLQEMNLAVKERFEAEGIVFAS
jgi:MscS family membrane protein